jgi:hypothetical protein|tara:strand:- start:1252 stop:2877 length:1626 start_codon:yes stop_codon:yes gene_type:complete
MANLTRIKILTTGATAAAPSNIKTGELAYSYVSGSQGNNGDRLYIGTGAENGAGYSSNVDIIGGKYFTEMLDHVHGVTTASSALIVDAQKHVTELNIGSLALEASGGSGQVVTSISTSTTLSGAANSQLATALAIKTYVDAEITAQDIDFAGDNSTTGVVDLDSQVFSITGLTGITTAAGGVGLTIDLDDTAVTAGTYGSQTAIPVFTVDQQGRLTAASTVTVATALTVDGDTGAEDVDLLTDDLKILGTANEVNTAVTKSGTDVTLQVGLPNDVTISNDLTVTTDLDVGSANFTVAGATGNTVIAGNLNVNGSSIALGNGLTDNVVISGNLTVQGTTTTVESTTVTLDDPVLALADNTTNAASDGLDRGVSFKWGNGSAVKTGFFGFDIQSQRFVFTKDEDLSSSENASAPWSDAEFGDVYATGADIGNIQVGITSDNEIDTVSGNLTIDSAGGTVIVDDILSVTGAATITGEVTLSDGTGLRVNQGGTGVRAYTSNAVLISNGGGTATNFISSSTTGAIVQFNASGVPIASDIIDGGTW